MRSCVRRERKRLRTVILAPDPRTREAYTRALNESNAFQVVGYARDDAELMSLCEQLEPDVLALPSQFAQPSSGEFLEELHATCPTAVLFLVGTDEEKAVIEFAERHGLEAQTVRHDLLVDPRPVAQARARTHLRLIGANYHHVRSRRLTPVRGVPIRAGRIRTFDMRAEISKLLDLPLDVVLLLGSSGTPELFADLLPLAPDCHRPLLMAVHHNSRFTASFTTWIASLIGRGVDVLPAQLSGIREGGAFVVPACRGRNPDPGTVGPSLDKFVTELVESRWRPLVIVLSGMGEDGVRSLSMAREAGGRVVTLQPEQCLQPGMVLAARESGLDHVPARSSEVAWLLRRMLTRRIPTELPQNPAARTGRVVPS